MRKSTVRKSRVISSGALAAAGALALVASQPAFANEQQLEQRIAELEAQVERMAATMEVGTTSELSLRVAELEAAVAQDNGLEAYWKNGLRLDSADRQFQVAIGGRTQFDFGFPSADSSVERAFGEDFETGARARRARLYVAGRMYGNITWKAEYDFAGGGRPSFTDVWMAIDNPCIGKITVGHHYEPFGLENMTSDLFLSTIERGAADALAFERNTGVSVTNTLNDGQWVWAAGVFRESNAFGDDRFNTGQDEWNFTGRIAGVAWEDEDEGQLLHVGVSGSMREPNEVGTFQTAGAAFQGGQAVSASSATGFGITGTTDADIVGVEGAFVAGPWSVQGEWVKGMYEVSGSSSDFDVTAWRVLGAYSITGESKGYNRSKANFSRPTPEANYGDGDGQGMLEAVLAYDEFDNDRHGSTSVVTGSEVDQWTVGLNWWLNPNTKVAINYFDSRIHGIGDLDGVVMRFQIDF